MRRGESRFKFLIWALCVSQGLVYIVSTPLWEGWDEAFHYSYIQGLAETRTLPVYGKSLLSKELTSSFEQAPLSYGANLNLDGRYTVFEEYWKLSAEERLRRDTALRSIPNSERTIADTAVPIQNYEAHQAPLYYLLAAPIYSVFSSHDVLTRAFVLRLFSLLIGSLVVPIAFAIVSYAGSERHKRIIPLLLVLLPLLYPTLARIANDSLAVPLFSALLLLMIRYFTRSCVTKDAMAIGVVFGLGLLTKAYFLPALPALGLIFLLALFTDRPRGKLLAHAVLIVVLASAISGAWYVRNYALYDNLSGMQEVTRTPNLSLADRIAGVTQVEWGSSLQAMFKQHIWIGNTSLLALSGATYQMGYLLIFLAVIGSARAAISWLRLPLAEKLSLARNPSVVILAIFYGFFVLGVLYHMLANYMLLGVPDGTGGWYLYAVIVAELILLVQGLESLAGRRATIASNVVLICYVLIANLVSLLCKTLPSYGGFIIPRFHLSHFVELYSPSGLGTMLGNLALNKPTFVTPGIIGMLIGVSLALLVVSLIYVGSANREKVG